MQDAQRIDNESSMPDARQRQVAGVAMYRVINKYFDVFKARGRNAIISDFRNYLLEKLGATESNAGELMRYRGEESQDHLYNYRTALRLIDTPAIQPHYRFENLLHPNAREYPYFFYDNLTVNAKDIMAYYWLAASDPNMELAASDLRGTNREMLLSGAKDGFVARIAEIFRAHNSDEGAILEQDQPSCGPGTIGRLLQSVLYNPIAAMEIVNPEPEFPNKIRAFILNKFRLLSSLDKRNIRNYLYKKIGIYDPDTDDLLVAPNSQPIHKESDIDEPEALISLQEEASLTALLQLLNSREFINQLIDEYTQMAMTPQRCEQAKIAFEFAASKENFHSDRSPLLLSGGLELLRDIAYNTPVIEPNMTADQLLQIARNPNTSIGDLRIIIEHVNVGVDCLRAIAINPNVSADYLRIITEILVTKIELACLRAITTNHNIGSTGEPSVADHLLAQDSIECLRVVAAHHNASAKCLRAIVEAPQAKDDIVCLKAIAANRNADIVCLKAIAANRNADSACLTSVATTPLVQTNIEGLRAVTENPNTSSDCLSALLENPLVKVDYSCLQQIRIHHNANSACYSKLAALYNLPDDAPRWSYDTTELSNYSHSIDTTDDGRRTPRLSPEAM